ncbi:MAG: hypothetical protein WBO74_19695 [Thermoanaerobaculia bacterium]
MREFFCCCLAFLMPAAAMPAETVTIPFGTTVFCELDQQITTRQKEAYAVQTGDIVQAHVWKDVWVDGHRVFAAGTPVFAKVERMKKARMAGQKGFLEIEVLSAPSVDRKDVPLDGGYDRSGRGRMGVTIGLAVALAWPFVFLKGKNVFLESGTIFDAVVRATTAVEVPADAPLPIKVEGEPGLVVEVSYADLDLTKKIKQLPLILHVPEGQLSRAHVVSVNGNEINPIQVTVQGEAGEGSYEAVLDFKLLSNHFGRGMNRFEIEMGGDRAEVLLEIEL